MARAVLKQVLLLGHFAPGRQLHVTVLTRDPESCRVQFLEAYPCFREGIFGTGNGEVLQEQVLARCS
jgi:hypothetical protein